MADIGKVGMVMKGAYNSANTYEVLDAVSYQGGTYIAKQAVPANTDPTNTTYWQPAVNGSELVNGLGFIYNTQNRAGNIICIAIGNNTVFKLTASAAGANNILFYIGYHSLSGVGATRRGIYALDNAGNIKDLSAVGGNLPTVSYDSTTRTYTITLEYNYAYVYGISGIPVTVTIGA